MSDNSKKDVDASKVVDENNEFINRIKKLYKDLRKGAETQSPYLEDDDLIVFHPLTETELSLNYHDEKKEEIFKKVEMFFETVFLKNQAVYYENYFEIILNIANAYWIDVLKDSYEFTIKKDCRDDVISYEISKASEIIAPFLNEIYGDYDDISNDLTSLKIYNINKVINKKINEPEFLDLAYKYVNSVIFEISYKASLPLQTIVLEEEKDDPFYDLVEDAKIITKTEIEDRYDKDLLSYYCRAIQMEESEFKYLAFFQVIECIFDEVYLHETVQDATRIIESNTFHTTKKEDVEELIKLINKHNNEKNDKTKTKLVLDKYFKGDVSLEAFISENKKVISKLKEIKEIKEDKEINDMQKIAKIIYDFRCKCTHSNRSYPKSRSQEYDGSKVELQNYIEIIKCISEKIILNYKDLRSL